VGHEAGRQAVIVSDADDVLRDSDAAQRGIERAGAAAVGAETSDVMSPRQHLDEHEQVIETSIGQGRAALLEIGRQLIAIREHSWHRGWYGTFENYLWKRWGMTRAEGYRFIDAALVDEALSPIGDIPRPLYESHYRELARLKGHPDKLREVWQELVGVELGDRAGIGDLNAHVVRDRVAVAVRAIQDHDRAVAAGQRAAETRRKNAAKAEAATTTAPGARAVLTQAEARRLAERDAETQAETKAVVAEPVGEPVVEPTPTTEPEVDNEMRQFNVRVNMPIHADEVTGMEVAFWLGGDDDNNDNMWTVGWDEAIGVCVEPPDGGARFRPHELSERTRSRLIGILRQLADGLERADETSA
jgi:hypothetical protein